jgi:cobalt/nickel transport system permease protein
MDHSMRHDFLDRFSRLDSPIHRLPSALKLSIAFALILLVILVPIHVWWVSGILPVLLLIFFVSSKIPWRFVTARLLILEPFVLGVAVMALFQHDGLTIFLRIVIKSSLCLLTVILLSNTTPFSEILSFIHRIGVPALLVTILALTYRYLFVLIDEAARFRRARNSRTFSSHRTKVWMSLASIIGQLFIRSTERSERIYSAMISRGWK